MVWTVIFSKPVTDWLDGIDTDTYELFLAAVRVLREEGPALGRPLVDRIKGAKLHNLKELRPGSSGRSEIRALFIFDSQRQAIVLVAGNKAGQWQRWYDEAIRKAEHLYMAYQQGEQI